MSKVKCEMCHTYISTDIDVCPNCGYKRTDTQDESTDDELQDYQDVVIEENKDSKKVRVFNNIKRRLIVTALVVISLGSIIGIISRMRYKPPIEYKNLSFRVLIMSEYDDGSAKRALNFKSQIIEEFRLMGIEDVETEEKCEDNDGLLAKVEIQVNYKDVIYRISSSFQDDKQVAKRLDVSGDSQSSLLDEFQGDKDVIAKLGKVLGVDNLVDIFEESRTQIRDKDGILVYQNTIPCISITQKQEGSSDLYHFTIMYDFFGK